MANKLSIPARAGAGSAQHATQTHGIPQFRTPKLKVPGVATQGNLTKGQGYPRKT